MDYYALQSILASTKSPLTLRKPSASFSVAPDRGRPYIEPEFQKVEYPVERPSILLVSAVGATGKTALAEALSRGTGLPILDLGAHKPVGEDSLTGLLTQAFDRAELSQVFEGIAAGTFGVIIDGIDEGRSKTTEKGFEAFLDNVAELAGSSPVTSFTMLGRTQVVEDTWLYLEEKGVSTGLITIAPFTIDDARRYIDAFTAGPASSYAPQYAKARDAVLGRLGSAFTGASADQGDGFLPFIGYPPVLEAIITLLNEEQNYQRLLDHLDSGDGSNVEASLLHRIAEYILLRERGQKVIPLMVRPLLAEASAEMRGLEEKVFTVAEQCTRLVAHSLGKQLSISPFGVPVFDEKYEAQVGDWLLEHPFLVGREFRNAVFEALALASLIAQRSELTNDLLCEYVAEHKHNYHLVYMLDSILDDRRVLIGALGPLLGAAMEFRSVHSNVELRVDGPTWDEDSADGGLETVEVEVGILVGSEGPETQTFSFQADVTEDSSVRLGGRLGGAFISVPCALVLGSGADLELIAPVGISAKSVTLEAQTLVLRAAGQRTEADDVVVEAGRLQSHLESIVTNRIPIVFALADASGVSYPAIEYVRKAAQLPSDPLFRQKYFRLRRILMEFRSHSKGALAKYKGKIEHERVLKNEIGRTILRRLLSDGILSLSGPMYFLDPERLSQRAGISWHDLRQGVIPESLVEYIRGIDC